MNSKKFILKPGNHQFIPGSHAIHNNNNLDDEEADRYLRAYPHIANLFERIPCKDELTEFRMLCDMKLANHGASMQSQTLIGEIAVKSVKLNQSHNNEDLPTPN